ncbi:MAG: sigma-70 family RNA polymerase sigma factor, partial [Clostridia bacterium]|nr:sigma-70 family RNA polymerase sigma factor [Clostridia bacterium]
VSRQDAASALFSETPVRSLDESVYEDEGSVTLGSTVADEEEGERALDRIAIKMAMEKLSELHRRLVVLRYFKDYSQQRTAEMLGLSQVKVSREEKKIMEILRRELA